MMYILLGIAVVVAVFGAYLIGKNKDGKDVYLMTEEEAEQMNRLLSSVRALLESDYSLEEILKYIDSFPGNPKK